MKFVCWKAWCCQPLCPAAEQPPWPNAREQIRDKPKRQIQKNITKMCPLRCAGFAILLGTTAVFLNKSQLVQSEEKCGEEVVEVRLGDVFGHHCKFGPIWEWWSWCIILPKNQRGVYLFWFWINQIFQFLEAMQFVLLWMILYSQFLRRLRWC